MKEIVFLIHFIDPLQNGNGSFSGSGIDLIYVFRIFQGQIWVRRRDMRDFETDGKTKGIQFVVSQVLVYCRNFGKCREMSKRNTT